MKVKLNIAILVYLYCPILNAQQIDATIHNVEYPSRMFGDLSALVTVEAPVNEITCIGYKGGVPVGSATTPSYDRDVIKSLRLPVAERPGILSVRCTYQGQEPETIPVQNSRTTDTSSFFDAAAKLNSRGVSFGQLLSEFKPMTQERGPEQRQADLAILWSIGETGSMCSILTGNIIGGAGLMDDQSRNSYMELVLGSISGCKQFISEKIGFLQAIGQVRTDAATIDFSQDLLNQLQLLRDELTGFETSQN
jgi:hypothetical protein